MNIVQTFYDSLAGEYDKLFADWASSSREQGLLLDRLFADKGFDHSARVLDCACGIGTQAIGLAALGYDVTGSDISRPELEQAAERAARQGVSLCLAQADFRALEEIFPQSFDIVIAMDNALPHMLSDEDLNRAVGSIVGRLRPGGIFAASIRDYDSLLADRPPYSPPYIHGSAADRRVSFQTWDWHGDNYVLTQYIIDDGAVLGVSKYVCEYRATRRNELTRLLRDHGCGEVDWLMPPDSGFYQPIVIARR